MRKRCLVPVVLLCACFAVQAQQADLGKLKKQYEDAYQVIESETAHSQSALVTAYTNELQSLRGKTQKAGDLDKLKTVLAEISRAQTEQSLPAILPDVQDVRTLAEVYRQRSQEVQTRRAQRLVAVASQYDKLLDTLQRKLTQEGKLDAATAVQTERKLLPGTEQFASARSLLASAQPARTSPVKPEPTPRPNLNDPDKGWTRLFRASGPTIWNTDSDVSEDTFAITLDKAPAKTVWLRMKCVGTNKEDYVIIPMKKEFLNQVKDMGGYAWNGARNQRNGHLELGIGNVAWSAPYRDGNSVSIGGRNGWGWGTSPPGLTYPGSAFAWKGQKGESFVVDISVKDTPLTVEEKNHRLK